jgi:hypothetical protein
MSSPLTASLAMTKTLTPSRAVTNTTTPNLAMTKTLTPSLAVANATLAVTNATTPQPGSDEHGAPARFCPMIPFRGLSGVRSGLVLRSHGRPPGLRRWRRTSRRCRPRFGCGWRRRHRTSSPHWRARPARRCSRSRSGHSAAQSTSRARRSASPLRHVLSSLPARRATGQHCSFP